MKPTWENTFNSRMKHWGFIAPAHKAARDAGYPYHTWNGRIYETLSGKDTGVLETDLNATTERTLKDDLQTK